MAQFSNALRTARGNQIQTCVNLTVAAGQFRLYNGTIPATADTALAGNTLILSSTLPYPTFLSFTAGVGTKVGTWSGAGVAAGTATFYRIYDSASVSWWQGPVGINAVASGTISGTTLTISAWTSGVIGVGSIPTGALAGTVITALGTGTGGAGTYTVSISQAATVTAVTWEMALDNTNIAVSQVVTVNSVTITEGNA